MRDDSDDSTPRDARDADHIWLRQSVTFSVNGRTRTLEMALPLRPGATPDEVDALLDEADAGMRRLSQRLDAHLAELAEVSPAPAPAATIRPDVRPAAAPTMPPTTPPAMPPPTAQTPTRRPTTPQSAPTPPAPAPAAKTAPASGAPDLTRPEFLAALRAMGLDVRSAMERLGVRSLDGLNLREALDLLDRQAVRDGDASPAAPARVSDERAAALAAMPAPIGRADAARFEEEDDGPDFELSYPDPDDLPDHDEALADEDFAPEIMAPAAAPLADVPDLNELLGATAAAPAMPQPAQSAPKSAEAEPEPAEEPAEEPHVARARAVIADLRAAHTGGQPTGQQRSAYQHVVVSELGETRAAGVIRAVWNLTPEKLGSEQYDALIRWGKLDTFGDEVEAVLELLRAEYRAAQQRNAAERATPGASPATPAAPAATPAAAPPTPRRPSQSAPAEQPPGARPAPRGRSSSARSQAGSQAGSQGGA